MKIIMNELKYARNLLSKTKYTYKDIGKKPSATLNLLARYYRENGFSDYEIKLKLSEFLSKCLKSEGYNEARWIDCISYQVRRSKKYKLKQIDCVSFSEEEMQIISNLSGKRVKKVAFALLALAKFYNSVNPSNNNWVNTSIKDIFAIANISVKQDEQTSLLHGLYKAGLIEVNKNICKLNLRVTYIGGEKIVLILNTLTDLGLEYLLYCGENYTHCQKCGKIIRNYHKCRKYCKDCAGYTPIGTKTVICCDCGKEFEVDSLSRKIRCDECLKIERQNHNRLMYQQRKQNSTKLI